MRAKPFQHLIAVELGHEDVEQDDVERLVLDALPAPPSIARRRDLVAFLLQVADEQPAVDRVVVYDEQPGHGGAHLTLSPASIM